MLEGWVSHFLFPASQNGLLCTNGTAWQSGIFLSLLVKLFEVNSWCNIMRCKAVQCNLMYSALLIILKNTIIRKEENDMFWKIIWNRKIRNTESLKYGRKGTFWKTISNHRKTIKGQSWHPVKTECVQRNQPRLSYSHTCHNCLELFGIVTIVTIVWNCYDCNNYLELCQLLSKKHHWKCFLTLFKNMTSCNANFLLEPLV